MYKRILAMLLLFGLIFAGTTVGVGETVTVGGTTTTTTTTTTTEAETEETESGTTPGGVVMTNEEGDSIAVGGEGGAVEEVSQGEVVEAGQQGNQEMGQQLFQVQKQEQKTILTSDGASASCNETLMVQNQNVYLEHNGNQHQIKVMPSQVISEELENAEVQDMVLEMHSEGPAYRFRVQEQRKFFWIFPVDSQTEYLVSAQTGEMVEEAGPWWGFLAPPTHNVNEVLQPAKSNS
ncbi:hypothetical protein GF415_02185 [Candidatus Micrarchaeota archaeon]|nr:hypothetical protein [Candidatus Micrarchaeota archaeon]